MTTLSFDIAPRAVAFFTTPAGFRLALKRNCSISPRGLLLVFGVLAAQVLLTGAGFAALGAWLILPFAGLEVLVLGAAFWLTARHATDCERLELERGRLRVEVREAERLQRYEMDARAARVRMVDGRVLLHAPQARLEVGRHLDEAARRSLAAELGKRLQS